MRKRYQVFVSSTYEDLKPERQAVWETIVRAECFPAGMEGFWNNPTEQFEFIKQVISDSDFYILIVGGRYGSIHREHGLSFTELEFDYARSLEKPIFAFLYDHRTQPLKGARAERGKSKQRMLEGFVEKVKDGRMVTFWTGEEDLRRQVSEALAKQMSIMPPGGWIPDDGETNESLRLENELLRRRLDRAEEEASTFGADVRTLRAQLESSIDESERLKSRIEQIQSEAQLERLSFSEMEHRGLLAQIERSARSCGDQEIYVRKLPIYLLNTEVDADAWQALSTLKHLEALGELQKTAPNSYAFMGS